MGMGRRGPTFLLPGIAPDAQLGFRFAPGTKDISIDDLEHLAKDVRALIKDVAQTVTGKRSTWILTELGLGSVNLAVAPLGLNGESRAATTAVFAGLRQVEEVADRPAFFSERALRLVGSLAKLSRKKGLEVTAFGESVHVTEKSSSHVSEILSMKRQHLGSIIGYLDVVSVHNGVRVTVYGQQGEVVPCTLSEAMLDEAKELLGKRVLVTGTLSVNAAGNPLRMTAADIFQMPPRESIKPLSALYASEPDITGGLSSAEFLAEAWREAR